MVVMNEKGRKRDHALRRVPSDLALGVGLQCEKMALLETRFAAGFGQLDVAAASNPVQLRNRVWTAVTGTVIQKLPTAGRGERGRTRRGGGRREASVGGGAVPNSLAWH